MASRHDPAQTSNRPHSRRRWIGLIAGAIAVAVLLAGLLYREEILAALTASDGSAEQRRPPSAVEIAEVERQRIEHRISATGTLQASEAITITARTRGRITDIAFKEGESVAAGDALVRLDRTRAQAAVEESRARVAEARNDLQRLRELKEQQFVSASELEQAQAAADIAAANLTRAKEDLRDRVVRAPFSGIIGRRLVSVGALLEPGTPVAELRRIDPLDLHFDVPETALDAIRQGQRVYATTPALPDERIAGEVTLVGTAVDAATRTLPLEATFPNPQGRLKPGMFLQAELVTGARSALTVPEAAVIARGPTQHVFVLDEQQAEQQAPPPDTDAPQSQRNGSPSVRRQQVKTGVRRQGWVEITSGLSAGQPVVTAGQQGLRDGAKVRPKPPPHRAQEAAPDASPAQPARRAQDGGGPETGAEAGRP